MRHLCLTNAGICAIISYGRSFGQRCGISLGKSGGIWCGNRPAGWGMPEELIEPTKTILETIEVVSPASDTVTVNPFDQLMQFVFMALFMVI